MIVISEWARSHTLGTVYHNLFSERLNLGLKKYCQPCDRLATLIKNLEELEKFQAEKRASVDAKMRNVKPGNAQRNFSSLHPSVQRAANYQVLPQADGTFTVQNLNDNGRLFLVSPNPVEVCNQELCLVKCKECGPTLCAHNLIN